MLVFSLRPGESFYVGDLRVQLLEVSRSGAACLRSGVAQLWLRIEDGLTCAFEELPDGVSVCVGRRQGTGVRVGVEAPPDVKVLREALYRKQRQSRRPNKPEGPARRIHRRAAACRECRGTMQVRQGDRMVPCPAAMNSGLPPCCE